MMTEHKGNSSAHLAHGGRQALRVGLLAVALLVLVWGLLGAGLLDGRLAPSISSAAEPETVHFQEGLNSYAGTTDTYINRWFPDTSYGWYNTMSVRAADYMSSLVRFDLSSIPNSATVISATLQLWCTGTGGQTVDASAFRVVRPWSESLATWNAADASVFWGTAGCNSTTTDRLPDPETMVVLSAASRWYEWAIPNMVQAWIANPANNQGVILRGSGEHFVQFSFASSEYWSLDLRPRLSVRYVDGPLSTATSTATATGTFTPTPTSTSFQTFTATPTGTVPTSTHTPTPTATPTGGPGNVEIRIVPDSRTALLNEMFTLDVMVLAPSGPVDSSSVYINFDPAVLQVVDGGGAPTNAIVPDATSLPILLLNQVNNGTGRIDYVAGAALPPAAPPSGYFRVATIRFKAVATAPGGTPVTFSFGAPRQTMTLYAGLNNLGSHTDGVVFVSASTATATATGTVPTATPTHTATHTLTPTNTATPTTPAATATWTATATATSTGQPTATRTSTPIGPTPGTVSLYLDPSPRVATVNEIFTLEIRVNASSQAVDSGAIYIDFDPTFLRVVDVAGNPVASIIPADPFSVVLENVVNNTFGTINYQAGIPSGPACNGVCTVATIRFKALVPTASTPLIFHSTVPRRTRMVLGGINQNTNTPLGSVVIGGSPANTATPTATTPASTATPTRTPTATSTGQPTATPTQTLAAPGGVSIALEPGLKIVTVGQTFDLTVRINAGTQPLDGAQVYVNVDPAVFQVVNVIPDLSRFADIVSPASWDNAQGHIGYAAGLLAGPAPTGSFNIATLRLQAIAPAGGSLIRFAFHPPLRDTKVAYQGAQWRPTSVDAIVLVSASGPVATATPTNTPTPTATPTLGAPSGTLTGRVILEGRSDHSGALVTIGSRSALTAANGTFTIAGVPVGLYTVRASRVPYLYADKSGVVITNGATTALPDVGLYGGDCNSDGIVDVADMVMVGMAWQATPADPAWNPAADINGDGIVDLVDLLIIGSNHERTAPTAWAIF